MNEDRFNKIKEEEYFFVLFKFTQCLNKMINEQKSTFGKKNF